MDVLFLTSDTAPVWAASLSDDMVMGSIGVFENMLERHLTDMDRAYAELCLGALTAEKAKRPHLAETAEELEEVSS